ncbi:sugar transferase [bacterium]|nr:sugar transferase [candidate division CSSED10-310 bacterium]
MKRGWLRAILVITGDLLLLNLSFIGSYWLRFYQEVGSNLGGVHPIAPFGAYSKALVFISYVWLFTFHLMGLYKFEHTSDFIDEIYRIIKATTFGTVVALSLTFFYRPTGGFNYSRLVILYAWILSSLLIVGFRLSLRKLSRALHQRNFDTRRVVVAGNNSMARFVVEKIVGNPGLGYRIIGFVDGDDGAAEPLPGVPSLGRLEDLPQLMEQRAIDEIVLARTDIGHYKLLEMVSLCEQHGIRLIMVPTVYDLLIDYADVYELEGIPLVALKEKPMNELSLAVKRTFDLVTAGLTMVLSLPLWLLIAVLIRRDSPGPVIFRQLRAGQDGKPFHMLKFRTMVADAEEQRDELLAYASCEEPVFKMPNDPRITRVGQFLRRSSLDELPQLVNVLKGEMSFIGPRPEEVCFVNQYDIWQRRRLKVKPGITGLQQIMCRGTLSLTERVKYDIYYIRKRSLLMDVWILLKTIPVVISGRGAN